jgi:hypothetical protein
MTFLQKLKLLFSFQYGPKRPLPITRRLSDSGRSNGPYELCIPQGLPRSTGHVLIDHRQQYSILLRNRSVRRCDANVVIDGKAVGTWSISAQGQIELEHPANDIGRFTFYMLGSKEARQSGLSASDTLGLVSVTFMPEMSLSELLSSSEAQFSPRLGGTGLSGVSEQRFGAVAGLRYDRTKFVTINVGLYCDDGLPRPLKSLKESAPSPLP